jgi:hypothetical protein
MGVRAGVRGDAAMSTAIQTAVNSYLVKHRVTFTTEGGERITKPAEGKDGKPWECYAWRVSFARQVRHPAGVTFDYFCGLAHATKPRTSWQQPKAIAPTAADVLYSLTLDAQAGTETFADFCDNYGYDQDSRRAERTYFECQDIDRKLRTVFTREQLDALAELVKDL